MAVLVQDYGGHDDAAGDQPFGVLLGADMVQAGPENGNEQDPERGAKTEPTP